MQVFVSNLPGKYTILTAAPLSLTQGDKVIVETEQGLGFGVVNHPRRLSLTLTKKNKQLKKVFRVATDADFKKREKNKQMEKGAFAFCQGCISKLGLKMNLFTVESTFDAAKLTFFYTAEGRVDFRETCENPCQGIPHPH